VVCYSNQVKSGVLGVSAALLEEFGPVSRPVAEAMALAPRALLGCDLAVAVTVGGARPGRARNPPGLFCAALATPEGTVVKELREAAPAGPYPTYAASYALDLVRRHLTGQLQ
jgi:nicotinamide-nucleotide amidase